MMNPIARRPSLPAGTAIPDFPAVIKALHIDSLFEVYLLEQTEQVTIALVVLPGTGDKQSTHSQQLADWWEKLGPTIEIKRPFSLSSSGAKRFEAVVKIAGEWMGIRNGEEIEEQVLFSLLGTLVNVSVLAADSELVPNLVPSLLWKSFQGGETRIIPLIASNNANAPDDGSIRQLAIVFYWIATGIDLSETPARDLKPLNRWCKTAGARLSSLIGRCLAPTSSDGITSIDDLRQQLTTDGEATPKGVPASKKKKQSGKATTKGLAKVAGMQTLKALLERDILKPLRDPEPFKRYGLTIPNGILLYGPLAAGRPTSPANSRRNSATTLWKSSPRR